MDFFTLIRDNGFPIAVACYLLWQQRQERLRCEKRFDRMHQRLLSLEQPRDEGPPDRPPSEWW